MANLCEGRVAIVTGAARGVGKENALLLAKEGARLVVNDLGGAVDGTGADATPAQEVANEIIAGGGEAVVNGDDVSSWDGAKNMIDQAIDTYGKLDILVNNAGILRDRMIYNTTEEEWDRVMAINAKGVFLGTKHAIPEMRKAGGGAIVNMSSVVSLRGSFPIHVYTAAKGGVISFTQVLAGTYAKEKIRANVICPGVIMTDRVRQRLGVDTRRSDGKPSVVNLESQMKKYPFSVGEPEDIARVALFLASDEARMMTGAVVPVDGGLSAY